MERAVDLKGSHILLVEDVAVNAEIMVMVLNMREIEVDVAENGRIAVRMSTGTSREALRRHPPGYAHAGLTGFAFLFSRYGTIGVFGSSTIRSSEYLVASGGSRRRYLPWVKSGKSTRAPPRAMEAADSGAMAIMVSVS